MRSIVSRAESPPAAALRAQSGGAPSHSAPRWAALGAGAIGVERGGHPRGPGRAREGTPMHRPDRCGEPWRAFRANARGCGCHVSQRYVRALARCTASSGADSRERVAHGRGAGGRRVSRLTRSGRRAVSGSGPNRRAVPRSHLPRRMSAVRPPIRRGDRRNR